MTRRAAQAHARSPGETRHADHALSAEAYEDLTLLARHAAKLREMSECASRADVSGDLQALVHDASTKTGLSRKETLAIVRALLNLHQLGDRLDMDTQTLLSRLGTELAGIAQERGEEGLFRLWEEGLPSIRDALERNAPFQILHKSLQLAYLHEKVVRDVRLITDIRPVFSDDASEIERMVITHQLIIVYGDESGTKRAHFALDAVDVATMEELCKRARKKAAILSKQLGDKRWTTSVVGGQDEQ